MKLIPIILLLFIMTGCNSVVTPLESEIKATATDQNSGKTEPFNIDGFNLFWSTAGGPDGGEASGYLYLHKEWSFPKADRGRTNSIEVKNGDIIIAKHISGKTYEIKVIQQTHTHATIIYKRI